MLRKPIKAQKKYAAGTLLFFMVMMAMVLLTAPALAVSADPYSDISGHWAKDTIIEFTTRGVVSGNGDGTFSPDEEVTREQFAKMLVLTFNADPVYPADSYFSDVTSDRWSYSYVEAAHEFLTGYSNPFGGKPAFQPTVAATREDVAVALVKMMGLSSSDAQDSNYAAEKFSDYDDISPSLRGYVNVATEQGLINGYSDGSFRPTASITRAEVLTMLSRASKTAVSDIGADINGEAKIIYNDYDPKSFTVRVIGPAGSVLAVNGKTLQTSDWTGSGYSGYIYGECYFQFTEEGSQDLVATITYQGQKKTIDLTATYSIGAPTITISSCPSTTNLSSITISGKVTDRNTTITSFQINGENVSFDAYNGFWSKTYELSEGDNVFTFTATNASGKTATMTKTVTFANAGPQLTITQCPEQMGTNTTTIRGTLYDANYSVSLTVNGKNVSLYDSNNGSKGWSITVDLTPGENTIVIIGTNSKGQTVKETRTINFASAGPTLSITQCPEQVTTSTATIRGTLYDANYGVSLTVNGANVSLYDSNNGSKGWSATVTLTLGDNIITIVGTNSNGQTATETRTITFKAGSPTITFYNSPETTTSSTITIEGIATDDYSGTRLYINDTACSLTSGKTFSKTVTLKEGSNTFVFRVVNIYGVEITVTKTIYYSTSSASADSESTSGT